MIIKNYTELISSKTLVKSATDKTYTYIAIQRKEKKVLLYNKSRELVKILNLEDYGIVDKRRRIPHKGSYIEVDDGERQDFKLDLSKELIAVWSEDTNLSLMKFDGTKIVSFEGAYTEAYFDKRNNILWAVLRNNNEHITINVIDYLGNILASLPMDDPLCKSMFNITELPEKNRVAMSLGAGQDGSQDYFFEWENNNIKLVKTVPDSLIFMFCDSKGKVATMLDFYDEIIYRYTYPALKKTAEFAFNDCEELEEYGIGDIIQVNDKYAIFCNDYDQRYYLFDLQEMEMGEEIVVEGYEPKEDKDGELCSDITTMSIIDEKLFIYPKGKVLVCELSELNAE